MPVGDPKAILLIDDEVGFTRLLKMNLERTGLYNVQVLNDPLLALDHINAARPDLIILDMVMPGMDGSELAAQIQKVPETSAIPIIFLTALVRNEESSVNDSIRERRLLLSKPVELPVLLGLIAKALEE